MKQMIVLACLAVMACAVPVEDNFVLKFEPQGEQPDVHKHWEDFKKTHGKSYETVEEELRRKDIFHEHLQFIEMHNYLHSKGQRTFRVGINHFADLKTSEFAAMMNGLKPRNLTLATYDRLTYLSPAMPVQVPDSVDWRDHGYVTPVKDQGQCGSCWSFSTTGALEGQHFRKTGKLVSLSEQNLVDCSRKYGNQGCDGGLMDQAFQYIKENDGIDTEESYPYLAEDGTCHYKAAYRGATDSGFVDMPHGDEDKLKEGVATVGPMSIAIDASHQSFQLYQDGVYSDDACSSQELDHGVLVVGYGTYENQDYWLVKNSWAATWGDGGYIKIARNMNNMCGVASQASYPLV